MAAQLSCPNCGTPLQITPDLYGKMVACPTCQATLKVPTPKQKAKPKPKPKPKPRRAVQSAPAPQPPSAPTPAPASDNPFAFDESASQQAYAEEPPEEGAWEAEEPHYEQSPRQRGGGNRNWGQVSDGLNLITIGIGIWYTGLTVAFLLAMQGGGSGNMALFGLAVGGLCGLAALILSLLGLTKCKAIPQDTGIKGIVVNAWWSSLIFVGGTILLIPLALMMGKQPSGFLAIVAFLLGLIVVCTMITAIILFFFFLVLTAFHMQNKRLTKGIIALVVGMYLHAPVNAGIIFLVPTFMPSIAGALIRIFFLGTSIGLAVWFFLAVRSLSTTIQRKLGLRSGY